MKKAIFALSLVVTITLFALSVTGCPNNDDPGSNNGDQNQAPTANAGNDFEHNITVSGTTITLNGSGTDTDGTIEGYAWTCTDKPNGSATPTFSNSAIGNPTVSGFDTLGDYEFSLKVKDNENTESTADVVKVSLVRTAVKNVEVSFPALVSGTSTLDFTPTYIPAIAGGGFEDSDVVYTVTNDKTGDVLSGTNLVISSSGFSVGQIIFTQTFKDKYGTEISTQNITVSRNPGSNFSPVNSGNPIPSIDITLSKKVSAGAITTTVDTTVEFVELGSGATIDFSPNADLPDGVTYILTDDKTYSWNTLNGFNGKVTASEHYSSNSDVIFTQTFYLYGVEITGTNSKRTVTVQVNTGFGANFLSSPPPVDSGSVTLKYP